MLQLQYFKEGFEPLKHEMLQSIVIKARVDNLEVTEEAIFDMTESLGTFFIQEDVYFNVPNGNLKLRIMHPNRCGQLIFNACTKLSGQNMSEAQITEVEDVYNIRATLGAALGELGVIHKKRRVFTVDDVRIYLDDVDGFGQFIDVSISRKNSNPEACLARAKDVREKLKIKDDCVVPVAYLDLLMRNMSVEEDDILTSSDIKSSSDSEDSI